jgi:leucyl aminopeptidase
MAKIFTNSKVSSKESLIILVQKNNLDLLKPYLDEEEMSILFGRFKKETNHVCFPKTFGALMVQAVKENSDLSLFHEDLRLAGFDVLEHVLKLKVEKLQVLDLSGLGGITQFSEGIALGNYQFLSLFSKSKDKKNALSQIKLIGADKEKVEELNVLVESVYLCRDLVNKPLNYLNAKDLSEAAKIEGKKHGFKVEVLDKRKIEALKMGGLLSVNLGSIDPPTFTIMEYKPKNPKNKKPIVLVGKGVVYDTGGLSLKPTPSSMDYMKSDMAGAAVVISAISAIAASKLNVHVVGLIPATDNRPSQNAYVPGDVITISDGTTVEVLNTDAEGRLILADALVFAKKYDPLLVIDLATLTGSAAAAIGQYGICYMGTAEKKTKDLIEKTGFEVYERLVHFPLWREYEDLLKSNIADLKNIGGPTAGMITAGKFLEHFTDYPWIHMDIAGPSFNKSNDGYRGKEGTGVGVRLIYTFVKNLMV